MSNKEKSSIHAKIHRTKLMIAFVCFMDWRRSVTFRVVNSTFLFFWFRYSFVYNFCPLPSEKRLFPVWCSWLNSDSLRVMTDCHKTKLSKTRIYFALFLKLVFTQFYLWSKQKRFSVELLYVDLSHYGQWYSELIILSVVVLFYFKLFILFFLYILS